jgi:hypothetical protein
MPKTNPNRNPFLKWLWCSGATFLLMVFVVAACIRGLHFNIGSTIIQFGCEPARTSDDWSPLFHVVWDGPTGEFTSGDIYGLRVWKWCLRLDIINDPLGQLHHG